MSPRYAVNVSRVLSLPPQQSRVDGNLGGSRGSVLFLADLACGHGEARRKELEPGPGVRLAALSLAPRDLDARRAEVTPSHPTHDPDPSLGDSGIRVDSTLVLTSCSIRAKLHHCNPQTRSAMKSLCALGLPIAIVLIPSPANHAQTIVNPEVSGTWDVSGNPYIAPVGCTILQGAVLTVQPGVVLKLGPDTAFTVKGRLIALGTHGSRISIQGYTNTSLWNRIYFDSTSSGSVLTYCDISDAKTGLWLNSADNNDTLNVSVFNSTFRNCVDTAIYCEAVAGARADVHIDDITFIFVGTYPTIAPVIRNCSFTDCGDGVVCKVVGAYAEGRWSRGTAYSYVAPTVHNSAFRNLTGYALRLLVGTYPGASTGVFQNNVVYECGGGISTQDPYDIVVKNNIFYGNTEAVVRTGLSSSAVAYNCFFQNAITFTGYAGYGMPVMQNRNGDLCDGVYNIFNDPRVLDTNTYKLTQNSPAIDAGDGNWEYRDVPGDVSQGSEINDLGIWGGSDAANWLENVPKSPVTLRINRGHEGIVLTWQAVPRNRYQTYYKRSVTEPSWTKLSSEFAYANNNIISVTNSNSGTYDTVTMFCVESLGKSVSQ